MTEDRIDKALKALGKAVPKAPEKAVEAMVKTVKALNKSKQQRKGISAPEKQVQSRSRQLPEAKKPAASKGMKK